MILILGKSTLAQQLQTIMPEAVVVGRPEYNLANKTDCDRLITDYDPTVVINTQGALDSDNTWDILQTNYVGVVYLTLGFYNKMAQGQIINISSACTLWTSYPDINQTRLCYNISKEAVSNFGRHFNRCIVDQAKPVAITTIEIGKFNSRINNYSGGMSIERAGNIVKQCIDNPVVSVTVPK
jgi:NAD(P)-dependent dehydrogenase (short-subunit alcohol dehydrogenase family)